MTARCSLSCVPLRAEPQLMSEMTSQLLFGEAVEVLEEAGKWWRVRCSHDGYDGWVDGSQMRKMRITHSGPEALVADLFALAKSSRRVLRLPLGSVLPDFSDGKFLLDDEEFSFFGTIVEPPQQNAGARICAEGFRLLDCPYMWGGRTAFGIDCSGLTQLCYKLCGIQLRRDSKLQAEQGARLGALADALPGDLAFFGADQASIFHVGIVLPNAHILHASGCVRIDRLTTAGIVSVQSGECTHPLVEIRRVVPE